MTFQRPKPRVINYWDYHNFNNEGLDDLLSEISKSYLECDNNSFDEFLNMCLSTLDQHAPWKQKCAREDHMPSMNKTLSKGITKRTKLPSKYLKERTDQSITTKLLLFCAGRDKERLSKYFKWKGCQC